MSHAESWTTKPDTDGKKHEFVLGGFVASVALVDDAWQWRVYGREFEPPDCTTLEEAKLKVEQWAKIDPVLESIVTARERSIGNREVLVAMPDRSAIEAIHGADAIESAIKEGVVAHWLARDVDVLTLTPLGAERLGVEIEERAVVIDDEEPELPEWAARQCVSSKTGTRSLQHDPYWAYRSRVPTDYVLPKRWKQYADLPFAAIPDPSPPVIDQVIEQEFIMGVPVKVVAKIHGKRGRAVA